MAIKKNNITKKEIKAIIDSNYKKASFLYNDKETMNQVFKRLEEFISINSTIIDTFDDLNQHITKLKDTIDGSCKTLTPEYIVSVLAVLMYLDDEYQKIPLNENIDDIRKELFIFISKEYKADVSEYASWEKWSKPGIYPSLPLVIVDEKEEASLEALVTRYEKIIQPTLPAKAGEKIKSLIPTSVQKQLTKMLDTVSEQELYSQIMKVISEGFDLLLKNTAKVSLSEDYIIKQLNKTFDDNHIFSLDQICYARSYDIAKQVNKFKTQNIFVAFAEGGTTGLAGLPGIPANLVASMFLYYRAIQSIAMYYGYDVKNNADELQIATDVFMQALSPAKGSTSEMGDMIMKFMTMTEALVVKDTIKGGWKAMAERGGICLLITQIRGLAHNSAKKAVEAAGKKGLEKTMFTNLFEQFGKKMTQDSIKKAAGPISALVTAFTDMTTMNRVIEFADIFYNKRFITEKQVRISGNNELEVIEDVDFEVITEE